MEAKRQLVARLAVRRRQTEELSAALRNRDRSVSVYIYIYSVGVFSQRLATCVYVCVCALSCVRLSLSL